MPGLSTKTRHRFLLLKTGIHVDEILEVKTFLKMSLGFKCRGPKIELRFCSFLGCAHFSIAGMDEEK